MRITFDQGPDGERAGFEGPRAMIVARDAAEVPDALAALDAARADGFWLAGYASYELGYALEPHLANLMPANRRLPLISFGVFDGSVAAGPTPATTMRPKNTAARWSPRRYGDAFATLHELIGAGDLYQANLTFPMDLDLAGSSAAALYQAIMAHQPVNHGVLIEQVDGPDILSRSPELFFRTDAGGRIQTRPMKGTAPRSGDPEEDMRARDALAVDEKNQAENLMIVDLLRNDIARVCQAGSVRVPELFKVETYATVHQMVSQIEGRLSAGVTLSDILRALFPCGSVTGAPKLRAMQVIRELEPWPREIYCGSIGWAAPDGRSEFNVAIRTILREKSGRSVVNVGGGVVWDSTAPSEYEEALWKARFLTRFHPEPA
jgi:para-aminobenzoate synthetase component I